MSKEKEYIFYKESFIGSVFADLTTFAFLIISFYINYKYIGNNGVVATILLIMFLLFIIAKSLSSKKVYYDKEKLIADLQKDELL